MDIIYGKQLAMLQTLTRTIDGRSFAVSQLPARRAIKLLNRILRLAGPAFGKLGSIDAKSISNMDVGVLGDAFATLCERLTDTELDEVMNSLLATVTVDGSEVLPAFDLIFGGDALPSLFKVLKFAFEVNYGSFFGAIAGFAKK